MRQGRNKKEQTADYADQRAASRAPEDGRARAPESARGLRGVSPLQAYALRPVTNPNCVAVRRGGEQGEVNYSSVG